jgi:hypothetical protein
MSYDDFYALYDDLLRVEELDLPAGMRPCLPLDPRELLGQAVRLAKQFPGQRLTDHLTESLEQTWCAYVPDVGPFAAFGDENALSVR